MKKVAKKRALISVSNKTGVVEFAQQLSTLGYDIISTGGTMQALQEAGIECTNISEVTHFPEILDGRVKTLHPNIFGGILARRQDENHQEQIENHQIEPIDLVVVNLYPFKETIRNVLATFQDAIENIDIGGPSMLRAAAKNHEDVTVIVDPNDYEDVIQLLTDEGTIPLETRKKLAAKVFRHTAHYDTLIAEFFTKEVNEKFPETKTLTFERVNTLRYGENPHQEAALYKEPITKEATLINANQLHGKALSYNNIQDANSAIRIVKEFDVPAVVAVKHTNPCGVGIGKDVYEAYLRAYDSDPISIFGGIVAFNRPVDEKVAEKLDALFLEVIIAPEFTESALHILMRKKNLRLLEVPMEKEEASEELHSVSGGLLVQDVDQYDIEKLDLQVVTESKPTEKEMDDLLFAWKVVKHVKSNAILLAKDEQTIGVGSGQMNRVGAAKIAIEHAKEKAKGAVMASDAFFPMPDTVEAAGKAEIRAIIQPGGSIRDQDSIDKCNELGIAMVFTNVRHFKH
mgnify:CR=1 FL=1